MATTVIDKLIVTLGLDPAQFKKGTKEAQQSTKQTEDSVTHSAGEMVGALRRVAAEFVSLFLVVRSVHDVVGLFAELNEATRQLGIDARNTDESAAHLRDWGNIAEIAGGKAEDALSTIAGLQQSIFNARQGYGWDEQLTNFKRLGVDTGVETGKMRDFHDILVSTATALQGMSGTDKFQWTQKLGLQGGIANAVTQGPEQLEKYWQQQLKIHQTTDADTRAAQQLAQAWDVLKDKMRAVTTQILTAVSPAIQRLFGSFSGFVSKHQGDITKGVDELAAWAQGPGPGHVVDALVAIGDAAFKVATFLNDITGNGPIKSDPGSAGDQSMFHDNKPYQQAEKKYGLPTFTLINKDLRGSSLDLEQTAATLKKLHEGAGGDKGDADWKKAIAQFKAKYTDQSKVKKGLWEQQMDWYKTHTLWGSPIADATSATVGAVPSPKAAATVANGKPTAANLGQGNNVSMHIDELNVNTQATDADGIARDIDGSLQRKLTVTLADGALS